MTADCQRAPLRRAHATQPLGPGAVCRGRGRQLNTAPPPHTPTPTHPPLIASDRTPPDSRRYGCAGGLCGLAHRAQGLGGGRATGSNVSCLRRNSRGHLSHTAGRAKKKKKRSRKKKKGVAPTSAAVWRRPRQQPPTHHHGAGDGVAVKGHDATPAAAPPAPHPPPPASWSPRCGGGFVAGAEMLTAGAGARTVVGRGRDGGARSRSRAGRGSRSVPPPRPPRSLS